MNVCRLSRPAVKAVFNGFPQRHAHIFDWIRSSGHEVETFELKPYQTPSLYLSYLSGMVHAIPRFKKLAPLVVIAEDMECALFALMMKKFFNFRFVFDFIDDYSLIIQQQNQPLRALFARTMETITPRLADLNIVVDQRKLEYCLQLGVSEKKIILVPNGCNCDMFKPAEPDETVLEELGLKSRPVVSFVGKLNAYYNLRTLIDAIPEVLSQIPDVVFLFVGDGYDVENLRRQCRNLNVEENVRFTGLLPHDKIPAVTNLSHVCVLSLPDESALILHEYMACAKPVVVPKGGTAKMAISTDVFPDDCLLRVDDSAQGFAGGIIGLLQDEEKASAIGARARERVCRTHDWNRLSGKYLETIEKAASV